MVALRAYEHMTIRLDESHHLGHANPDEEKARNNIAAWASAIWGQGGHKTSRLCLTTATPFREDAPSHEVEVLAEGTVLSSVAKVNNGVVDEDNPFSVKSVELVDWLPNLRAQEREQGRQQKQHHDDLILSILSNRLPHFAGDYLETLGVPNEGNATASFRAARKYAKSQGLWIKKHANARDGRGTQYILIDAAEISS